ncbi:MAG: hypothetical protein JKY50_13280 [Oleispira sp.]|nr:hypothetical protein [Oleispira sp.]MBL4880382.1 hypothetical protein [Oleispira sp.]
MPNKIAASLPYFTPNKDIFLNAGLVILILNELGKTQKGKPCLNLEKLLFFFYIIKKPLILNGVLSYFEKPSVQLNDVEYYSVESISQDQDALFNRKILKDIIKMLSIKNLIKVEYKKSDGFMYYLSKDGISASKDLRAGYFLTVKKYLEGLKSIQSTPITKLTASMESIQFNHG